MFIRGSKVFGAEEIGSFLKVLICPNNYKGDFIKGYIEIRLDLEKGFLRFLYILFSIFKIITFLNVTSILGFF